MVRRIEVPWEAMEEEWTFLRCTGSPPLLAWNAPTDVTLPGEKEVAGEEQATCRSSLLLLKASIPPPSLPREL